MGSAAYRRGSDLIRRQISEDTKNWDGYPTYLENKITRLESSLLDKEAEIEALKSRLARTERYMKLARSERDVLKEELASCRKSVEYFKSLWLKVREDEKWFEEKWRVLSQIVRRAVPANLYHEIRQEIKDEWGI